MLWPKLTQSLLSTTKERVYKHFAAMRTTLIGARLVKSEKGFVLLESLIALVLLGLVAAAVFPALGTAVKVTDQADVRTIAVSLAYGQMEAIKATTYTPAVSSGSDGVVASYTFTQPSDSRFVIWSLNNGTPQTNITNRIYGIPWNLNNNPPCASNTDADIQQVTLIINFNGNTVFKLVDFVRRKSI